MMKNPNHLENLKAKHDALDKEIMKAEAMKSSANDMKIAKMKKEKLMLKEEINKLSKKA